ncbi:MAG: hypothetical protein P0Y53_11165 [Candidatus Pseudobacter hemicellulosilyticus]|uniref:Uncharacterized protein n=1 Tax=Candidatus Pseudobacter hemicellulosilyticus TaxID=3121375 RepID=A0AAJ6BJM3_9BACT|nr:MAG: hypothetical protein P0Y53_11165 [Pseudobacter sp.]
MKKLFAILAVAGVLVACNDSGKTEDAKAADSVAPTAAPAPDSTLVTPDSTKTADSTHIHADSAK